MVASLNTSFMIPLGYQRCRNLPPHTERPLVAVSAQRKLLHGCGQCNKCNNTKCDYLHVEKRWLCRENHSTVITYSTSLSGEVTALSPCPLQQCSAKPDENQHATKAPWGADKLLSLPASQYRRPHLHPAPTRNTSVLFGILATLPV